LARVGISILLVIVSFSVFVSLAALVAGPFNEELSQAIEEELTGKPAPPFRLGRFLFDLAVGAVHAIRRVIVYVVTMGVLLVVGLVIPGVGPLISTALGAAATARFASYDGYDAVFSRRRWRYRDKVAYLRRRRWRTLGLGAVVAATTIVPVLNLVALSFGAAGATLAVLDEERPAQPARKLVS
jgi:CysZ protein